MREPELWMRAIHLFTHHASRFTSPMPVPVISVAQMREWEQATWAAGQTEQAVIARVGEHLAQRAVALTRSGDSILLLAGKGHNGDDARAMLPHLHKRDAHVIEVTDPLAALPKVNDALQRRPKLIVDGLFGVGLNRDLDPGWCDLIELVNQMHLDVLAVDVPSGLDAQTGRALPIAIRATLTMTVGAPKRGFFSIEAADYVGRLEVATEVGLLPCPVISELQWTLPTDFGGFPSRRPVAGHKGTFGHAAIVAGSLGYHGASVLAARGAQRARPGLITLLAQPEIYNAVAAQLQAVMVHPWRDDSDLSQFTAVLFGPGLAAPGLPASVRDAMQRVWSEHEHPVLVDASALAWLHEVETSRGECRVITPHPGEAARLLNCSTADIQRDRLEAVRELSKRFGDCWVVLKGQHTLIGRAEGDVFVNSSGNSGLAQGGTGDLLAGYIIGWLAQPALQEVPLDALRYAVWEHGAAADRLAAACENWIVEELADELGGVVRSQLSVDRRR
jgi:ADP-dependent NAD(P)H-hydrate dehydratase / NAD(P)H-hydrate epimerase